MTIEYVASRISLRHNMFMSKNSVVNFCFFIKEAVVLFSPIKQDYSLFLV